MTLALTTDERAILNGDSGAGTAMAMELLTAFADAIDAPALIPITGAHIDGCLYHGEAGLDFVEALLKRGACVRVPTTLNVGSIDLIHPELMRLAPEQLTKPRRLMKAHEELGCVSSFTCAPYQTLFRPQFGNQIAWGESNAIVFANSVIGARTERYGDFMDLCCAIVGRVPAWGLHLEENRHGRILFELTSFSSSIEPTDSLFIAVGLLVGAATGDRVPVIEGLPQPRDEDQLKALGAAAASVGAVGMFHIVGITPEAPTREVALGHQLPEATIAITPAMIRNIVSKLSTVPDDTPIAALCLGTPHFSYQEWQRLAQLLKQVKPAKGIPIYVNTARATLDAVIANGLIDSLMQYGLIPVVDTCTYVTAILEQFEHPVMTNSGKWAQYAPGNIGCSVAFGDLADCIASAAAGQVVRA